MNLLHALKACMMSNVLSIKEADQDTYYIRDTQKQDLLFYMIAPYLSAEVDSVLIDGDKVLISICYK